ncbi:hypothetical protein CMsap09_13980 [Clavibacter michiganensis]|uniref:Uncharacterized protein n=1 Tax=Clavibacter michiganensis TaxID=28447 RepID=A0A251XX30_9MICO|nr:hypothetical protein CMsap09_13980 [Clavibacter michiganensis]
MIIMSMRFEQRSTMTPPRSPKRSMGANCMATVTPTAVTLPVSSSTSQSWAMRCIHPEVMAMTLEAVNRRKFGTLRAMRVWRHGGRRVWIGSGAVGGKTFGGGVTSSCGVRCVWADRFRMGRPSWGRDRRYRRPSHSDPVST